VLLLGLDDETRQLAEQALRNAGMEAESVDPDEGDLATRCASASSILVGGEAGFEQCRQLRTDDQTWQIVMVLCLSEPTEENVIHAMDAGASRVLHVPCSEDELLRSLS
jgi:DNA-binding response OmpR family regulator